MRSVVAGTLDSRHPLKLVNTVLRLWLVALMVVMTWNAFIANEVLLTGWIRPVPFIVMSVLAIVWALDTWNAWQVAICSSTLGVGLVLRGIEVLVFQEKYDMRTRLTAMSVWLFVGVSVLVFGFMNLVMISRVTANSKVWGPQ